MSLRVEGLCAGYGELMVIRDVDIVVPALSVVAVLGSNGAGKTTLLRTIAGQLEARTGSITLDGNDITRLAPTRRATAGLCLIPEGRGIFPSLTVAENIAMFVNGSHIAEATDAVAQVLPALADRLGQRAGTLSGGEQQMLALSRALITDPTTVLADELSVGLAPVIIDKIFDLVSELRARGHSLLIVEQYVDRVLDIADWVYVLHRGQVVYVGEPAAAQASGVFDRYLRGAA